MTDIDPQFLAFLNEEESRAYDGTLLQEVEAAINSYNGAEYGDEEEGRSQVVSRDVAEVIDYMLTSIMDVMVGSTRVVELEPQNEQDEDICDDATEALHALYRKKSGFRFIHDWAKGGLAEKVGVSKSCVERKKKRVDQMYHPAMIPDHAIEAEETQEPHPIDGSPMVRAVTLEETAAEFKDYYVPLEEFAFSPDTPPDLDCSPYLNHHPMKSLSDLVEMGFDREVVETLQDSSSLTNYSGLSQARNDGRSLTFMGEDRPGMLRRVRYLEEYTFYDLDNDGIAERLKVCRVGNTILDIEVADSQPFEWWCPFPMQGRAIGQSLADKTMDIQRINTVLERLMLDSLYLQLAPGTYVDENFAGDHTFDDLLNVRPGRIVRTNGGYPEQEKRVDVSGTAQAAIEFKIRQRESRTGITRLNKGVDEDTLNDTARGQAQLMSRGQQMERYIIRNFAEGVARLFMKKVGLMRKYAQPFQIRVDGEYRQIDPSQWPEDMEVNVKVGLGSGSKDERIMGLQTIGQAQAMLKETGSPIVTDDNVYNAAKDLTRAFGMQPNDYFTEPPKDEQGNPVPQQQPPDPKAQALMAELQMKQQQMQQAQQEGQAKLQMMAQKNASDAQIAQAKAELEASLAVRQQNMDAWLQREQMRLEQEKHDQDIAHAAAEHTVKVQKLRSGGALNK